MDKETDTKTIDVLVCRRIRDCSGTGCGKNLDEEEFAILKELEAEYAINIKPSKCLGRCPYEGFTIQRTLKPEIVSSIDDLREKIEAYKKERVSEGSNGYSDRR